MPRIPIIEQTTNVATTTPTPQAQGSQVVSPMGNAGAIAEQGLNTLAEAQVHTQNALTLKENADAVANTGKPLSDADVYWKQYVTDASKNTVDGGMVRQDDGTTIGFRDKAGKDFDTWAADFMKPITNEKAKIYAQNHVNQLRTQVLDNAITFEANAGIANRSAKVDEAVTTWASVAAKDDRNVQQLITSAKTMIANSGFDEKTRNDKALAATKQIVEAAVTGSMERDPKATKAALLARYGVDPTAPVQSTASAPSAAVTRNADGTVSLATDPSLPAGMRNNNPGNIVYANQKDALGPSVNRDNGGKSAQAVYATPDEGLAAMFQLALRKYGGGKTTADTIIASQGGWTPGNHAAAANVAATLGISKDADLNLRDPEMLKKFGRALMLQEHGNASKKYSDEMVSRIADDVSAGRAVTPGAGAGRGTLTPPAGTGAAPVASYSPSLGALVDQLPVDRLPAYISHANTLVNQQQAVKLLSFQDGLRDSAARADQGIPDQRQKTEAEFVDLLGADKGPMAYREYADKQQFAGQVSSLTTASPQEFQDTLARRKAIDPQAPGFAGAAENTAKLEAAWDRVTKMRTEDPAAYTLRYSDGVKKSYAALVDAKTPDQVTAAAGAFATTTLAEQMRLGVAKPQILPKSYADSVISQFYKQDDGGQNASQLMQQLASTWGNRWPEVFKQISADLPPVAKVLGTLGPEVSAATKSLLASTAKLKIDDLRSGVPSDAAKDLDDKLVDQFGALKKSMAFQVGGVSTFDTVYDSAKRLAYVYAAQGMKPADASTKAFDNLIGKTYQFLGTARVPLTYDLGAIERGTDFANSNLSKLDIMVPPHPAGVPEPVAKTQYINGLLASGQSTWVTDANEKGLVLYDVVSNTPVKLKNGQDVRFDWDDLMQKGGPSMLQRMLGQTPQGMPPPAQNNAAVPDLSKTKDKTIWNR